MTDTHENSTANENTASNSTSQFTIYPAIDIIGGKCVRLSQGDYDSVKVYSDDPIAIARSFYDAGARWIHIVDLDAAKTGIPSNHKIIARIAKETDLSVQTGGGIRNMEILDNVLNSDVRRAILGTSAVKDWEFTENAIRKYGDRIVIGIDAKNGEVAVDGWTSASQLTAIDFAQKMQELGARTVIYTDISRDGMFKGTHIDGIKELVLKTSMDIIASGGVAGIGDVTAAKSAGASGVIIGKALYEGRVDLKECLLNA
jgi:phosphoribosylformimino-5-aminoimidazole carboxamide ribotide isomerase